MNTDQAVDVRTRHLGRLGGRIGYEVAGSGPLVVAVPGMGDLRGGYRFLGPALREAGYRVACTDLRGHGDSDVGFDSYGDVETAGDIIGLIEELGGPAVVIGNSMGAASAVIAAVERPDLVNGIVLIGPFVRDAELSPMKRMLFRVAMARPWAAMSWNMYLPKLYAGRKPDDFDEYRRTVAAGLGRPGYGRALSLTTRTGHAIAEARLGDVAVPGLVVMGEADPDFPDPRAEAQWIGDAVHGEVVMVADAGHYPQSQQPEVTVDAVVKFLTGAVSGAVNAVHSA